MNPDNPSNTIVDKIRGVVFPVLTPFTANGDVDSEGLRGYVNFLTNEGAQTLMVTVGTSRFNVLTYDEMRSVNTTVAQAAQGKAVVIVTGPPHGPASLFVEFARSAADAGADAMLAVYPDRFYSEQAVEAFFAYIAEASPIPIMIHLTPMPSALGGVVRHTPDLLERLAGLDNIVGIKEEMHDQGLSYAYNQRLANRFAIVGGAGGMRAYLTAHMWGQPAYLAGIGNFFPRAELVFVQAMQRGDLAPALRIVNELETPFFNAAVPFGWHVALKEALHGLGLMSPEERLPMARVEPGTRERIKRVTNEILQRAAEMFQE